MRKEDLRIVFMGTPEFAVGTLKALVENEFHVVAVVTQPDKPVGRHGSVLRALLSFISNIPLFIEEKLMKRQSVPYQRSSNGVAMPLNAISNKMLQEALDKAVEDENYELGRMRQMSSPPLPPGISEQK